MANHERAFDGRVADTSVVVGVKIAAADPGCLHAQQDLAGARRPRDGHALDAEVPGPVQPRREHEARAGASGGRLIRR